MIIWHCISSLWIRLSKIQTAQDGSDSEKAEKVIRVWKYRDIAKLTENLENLQTIQKIRKKINVEDRKGKMPFLFFLFINITVDPI